LRRLDPGPAAAVAAAPDALRLQPAPPSDGERAGRQNPTSGPATHRRLHAICAARWNPSLPAAPDGPSQGRRGRQRARLRTCGAWAEFPFTLEVSTGPEN